MCRRLWPSTPRRYPPSQLRGLRTALNCNLSPGERSQHTVEALAEVRASAGITVGQMKGYLGQNNCIIAHATLYGEVLALFQSGRHVDAIGTLFLFVCASAQRLGPRRISQVNGCDCWLAGGGFPVLAVHARAHLFNRSPILSTARTAGLLSKLGRAGQRSAHVTNSRVTVSVVYEIHSSSLCELCPWGGQSLVGSAPSSWALHIVQVLHQFSMGVPAGRGTLRALGDCADHLL